MKCSSAPILQVDDLSISFRTKGGLVEAVRNVTFAIARGETVAIVGESGSGKSTTAASVNGLLDDNGVVTNGSVWFDGRDIIGATESVLRGIRGAGIGLVPQDPMSNLNPLMRVGDQIAEALEVHDLAGDTPPDRRAIELLDMVGIPDPGIRARQYPHQFSGGMRQRVLIAMGLACQPPVVIADEPTSALDVTVQKRVLDELSNLTGELGTAVLLITHDLALAAERADRVLVMYQGQIVEQGDSTEILSRPGHEYAKRLLAAVPDIAAPLPGRPELDDEVVIDVRDLIKRFPLPRRAEDGRRSFVAVDQVSFQIRQGATVSVVGESGSGKTTVANIVLGLEDADSGEILYRGEVRGSRRREMFAFRSAVQPVFQNPYASLDPRRTVEQSITEPMEVHRLGDAAARRERARGLLDQVALPRSYGSRRPHELSGGERQRVAIARALALSPQLVVLDEAVSALDVLVQAQILDLLSELQRDLRLSYLFISHDLAVVRQISDEVHVMSKGRIVESGHPKEIFDHPKEDYTRALIDAIPRPTSIA